MMRKVTLALSALMVTASVTLLVMPSVALAVEEIDFHVVTADDLIDVCSTSSADPLYTAAANFCQGYVVGAFETYRASVAKGNRKPFVCLPTPGPNRTDGIARFVAWGKMHPEYKEENPINFLFKFLNETWPCPDAAEKTGSKAGS